MRRKLSALFLIFILFGEGCFSKKTNPSVDRVDTKKENEFNDLLEKSDEGKKIQNQNFDVEEIKNLAVGLRFIASLEREMIKVIQPKMSLPMTPFEILSVIFDQASGIKKNFMTVDCQMYQLTLKDQSSVGQTILIYKKCIKPAVLIAKISLKYIPVNFKEKKISEKNKKPLLLNSTKSIKSGLNAQVRVHFFIKEWASVVGDAVALTGVDRLCFYQIKNNKVFDLNCKNTAFTLNSNGSEIQELRLSDFKFNSSAQDQVQIQGGYFKNLVMHRKLQLKIPFIGTIKLIEKELKVRDDFSDENKNKTTTTTTTIENKPPESSSF